MTSQEYKQRYDADVEAHRGAEAIVVEVLNNLDNGYHFEDVAQDERYYNKGDIKMIKEGVKTKCLDVKDDGEIAKTGNFAVEAGGYSKLTGAKRKGWIDSQYDYVAVISQKDRTIWILSFRRLKEIYDNIELTGGRKVTSNFWDNVKYNYLIPVRRAIQLDAVLAKIEYEYDDWCEAYMPVSYKTKKQLKVA